MLLWIENGIISWNTSLKSGGRRPIAVDGEILIRPVMYVALSYDHRIVDGREAIQFLVQVKEGVEDPEQLLLEG